MTELRWKLASSSVAILYRHQGIRRPEPLVFLDCIDPAHLSRLMEAAERTITVEEGGEDEG